MQTTPIPIVDVKSVVVGCFILLALGSVGGKLFDIIQLLYGPLASCINETGNSARCNNHNANGKTMYRPPPYVKIR